MDDDGLVAQVAGGCGGAICACLVFAAGLMLITVRGPRELGNESGPAS